MGHDDSTIAGIKAKLRSELLEIDKRDDLTLDQKVNRVRHITCAVCAGVAVQPIPFADIFILTPIQALMGSKIAAIHGVPVSEATASEVIKELAGVIGLSVMAQQFAIGAYKTVLPFLGAITTIPLVYGLTYAMGGVMDYYFKQKAAGRPIDDSELKRIWKRAKKAGVREGKSRKSDIEESTCEQ